MASFLDNYDEFGNYIGADLGSDDESDIQDDAPQFGSSQAGPSGQAAPLEGYDEPMAGGDDGGMMEVDGSYFSVCLVL
jgi:U5 small nuclear ribonucleoprotein component